MEPRAGLGFGNWGLFTRVGFCFFFFGGGGGGEGEGVKKQGYIEVKGNHK